MQPTKFQLVAQSAACNPKDTFEQITDTIYKEIKKQIEDKLGQVLDPQAAKAIRILAEQLAAYHQANCGPNKTCKQISTSAQGVNNESVDCFLVLCKEMKNGVANFSLSGTCQYKCRKAARQRCCCGESLNSHFSGISWTTDPNAIIRSACDNYGPGVTEKL
jgi:hypothetical protein